MLQPSGTTPPAGNRWLDAVRGLGTTLLDAVWAPTCLACGLGVDGPGLCSSCGQDWQGQLFADGCQRCGRARPSGAPQPCGACATESHWNLRGVVCAGRYRGVLRDLLLQVKFLGEPAVVNWCGQVLADAVRGRDGWGQIDCLVPVPMHPLRRWQRKGNHAAQLARVVSTHLGVPVQQPLRRTRWVDSQTSQTSRQARLRQVRDSFAVGRRSGLGGKTVCIVDNVLVSGATLHEVSRVLRAAGAKRIYAAAVGRS